jgi:hypothetical protein
MAKMLVPETEQPKTAGRVVMSRTKSPAEERTSWVPSRAAPPMACIFP